MLKNYPIKGCLIRRNLFKITFEKLMEAFINFFTLFLPSPSLSQCVLRVRLSAFLSWRVEAALILGFNTRVWWQSSSGLLKWVPLVTPLAVCQPWTRCFSLHVSRVPLWVVSSHVCGSVSGRVYLLISS